MENIESGLTPLLIETAMFNKKIADFPKEIRQKLVGKHAVAQFVKFAQSHKALIDASPTLSRVYQDLTESRIKKFFAYIPRKIAKIFQKSDPSERIINFERNLLKGKVENVGKVITNSNDVQKLSEIKLSLLYADGFLPESKIISLNEILEKLSFNQNVDGKAILEDIHRIALKALNDLPSLSREISDHYLMRAIQFFMQKRPQCPFEELLPILNLVADKSPYMLFNILQESESSRIRSIDEDENRFNTPSTDIPILEYFNYLAENDKELLLKLFGQCDPHTDTHYFQSSQCFGKLAGFFEALAHKDYDLLFSLFSLQNPSGKTCLHEVLGGKIASQPETLFIEILRVAKINGNEEEVAQKLLHLYGIRDINGLTCMQNSNFKYALDKFPITDITAPLIYELLQTKDAQGTPAIFNEFSFESLSNHPNTVLNLIAFDPGYRIPLFEITDAEGNTLFHKILKRPDSNDLLRGTLLRRLTFDHLIMLLEKKNSDGQTPLDCIESNEWQNSNHITILLHFLKDHENYNKIKTIFLKTDNHEFDDIKDIINKCKTRIETIKYFLEIQIRNGVGNSLLDHVELDEEERPDIAHWLVTNALMPTIGFDGDFNLKHLEFVLNTINLDFTLPDVMQLATFLLQFPVLLLDVEKTPNMIHNFREGSKCMLASDIDPFMRQQMAVTILRSEIFDQDDHFFPILVCIASENSDDEDNSNQIYIKHLKNLQIPTNVIPPTFWICGDRTALSLEGLQTLPKLIPKDIKDIPKDATKANWNKLKDSLKNKIEGSVALNQKYNDFSMLWNDCLSDPFLEQSLEITNHYGAIPPHKLHFAAIVHWILSHSDKEPEGDPGDLTGQEDALYKIAYFIANCSGGKRQNISAFYFSLPNEFKYPAKVAIFQVSEEKQRALHAAFLLVEQTVAKVIQTNRRLISQLNGVAIDPQEVHAIEYIQNSIGHLVGLGNTVSYDPYTGVLFSNLLKHSRDEILRTFLHIFTPETLTETFIRLSQDEPLVKKSDEDTFNDLMAYLISPSTLFWNYSDDETHRTLTRQGALQILREIKVVTTINPRILSSWQEELAFIRNTRAEELGVIPEWDSSRDMNYNMKSIKNGVLENIRGRTIIEKCQWLAKWIERSGELKKELSANIREHNVENFEKLWSGVIAEVEKNYIGQAELLIKKILNPLDSLSTVTLLEEKNGIVDILVPAKNGFGELKQTLKNVIDSIALERLRNAILDEGDWTMLNYTESILFSLGTSDAKEQFKKIAEDEKIPTERWAEFKSQLKQYVKELGREEFNLRKFSEFCDKSNGILPSKGLDSFDDYRDVVLIFEALIQKVMDGAKEVDLLDVAKVKEKYDKLAAKFGQAPMKIDTADEATDRHAGGAQ